MRSFSHHINSSLFNVLLLPKKIKLELPSASAKVRIKKKTKGTRKKKNRKMVSILVE